MESSFSESEGFRGEGAKRPALADIQGGRRSEGKREDGEAAISATLKDAADLKAVRGHLHKMKPSSKAEENEEISKKEEKRVSVSSRFKWPWKKREMVESKYPAIGSIIILGRTEKERKRNLRKIKTIAARNHTEITIEHPEGDTDTTRVFCLRGISEESMDRTTQELLGINKGRNEIDW